MTLPMVYVIRIYRRSGRRTGPLAGTVEPVSGGIRRVFSSSAGLWEIISGKRCATHGHLPTRRHLHRRSP